MLSKSLIPEVIVEVNKEETEPNDFGVYYVPGGRSPSVVDLEKIGDKHPIRESNDHIQLVNLS